MEQRQEDLILRKVLLLLKLQIKWLWVNTLTQLLILIALVKTAAVGGTGKLGDQYHSNQYREHYPQM
jgi:hypothetical protein